ncbi:MAG: MBL fold metallo-hydrolase [Rubrivivax sp.]|nr:MBL fold metallo-hydrolase [Rubrivivax sp.]
MNYQNSVHCLSLAAAGLLLAGCATPGAPPNAAQTIQQAQQALKAGSSTQLSISGRGTGATFGQAWQPGLAWPGLNYSLLKRTYNTEAGAYREEFGRSRSEPNGGGATPLMGQGEARVTGFARETFAWNAGAAPNAPATPAPVAQPGRINDLWTSSPHSALAAAKRYQAVAGTRVDAGQPVTTLNFAVPGQLKATVVVDSRRLVTRVESTMPHPVLGDTAVLTEFLDYADAGGGQLPKRIRQTQGGFPVLDLVVSEYRTDDTLDAPVPDNVRSAHENVAVQPVSPGVWFLAGGTHNSVAVELSDQILLIESPLYDGRALAVMAAANKLVPNKTVKTVVNSHHHFDHAGGLRAAAGEGAQLITSAMAKPYFERLFANPNTVAPDRLAQSGRKPTIVAAGERTMLRDALRPVEIHEMQGSIHAQGFLMVWLPNEKLLVQADAYTPGPPNSPPPPAPNANHVNLVQNLERLGFVPDRILPLHSRVVPYSELLAQIGRN